ncbi:tail length tape measure domain protein, partial [Staphylococcus aureus]
GMTREQKLATVATIVGTEAASGFLALIEAGQIKLIAIVILKEFQWRK